MPYTYESPVSESRMHITRCEEGLHLMAESNGDRPVPVCVRFADVPEVLAEMTGRAQMPAEKIVKWSEVREGDEVLVNGRMETVTALGALGGPWTEGRASLFLGGTWYTPRQDQLTAVRRYGKD
jgi:hypothetical protein